MRGFFSEATSFNITMDMLFTKGSFENALVVLRTMREHGVPFNKDTLTLATAICYKMNTAESYRICTALMEEVQSKGHAAHRHAYCFAVALALRQSDMEKAKLLYAQITKDDSRLCQNLKVDLLRLRTEGGPHMITVEQIVTHLERADQVTQQTLDAMLCHTPTGKRKPSLVMDVRKTSQRTLKSLQSNLLSE
ncbi:Pentatricopeptide repeat-containing protein 2, mitochondrial [Liparis tanakae]|uniref:Pentatricopeptide repeat-containing protein 2, mitochondrial n=1 Tax=Liparis tanakae TaxID=230148 RepID=A0A4Z2HRB1_9TELE|nr:Pentatricopeptide repeat-containing protein 2, mitochondrial [Liparis tanakae]